jgi:hypothetical protein
MLSPVEVVEADENSFRSGFPGPEDGILDAHWGPTFAPYMSVPYLSVPYRKPPRVLYFARIPRNLGNISFGRAFLVTVRVRNVEVRLHARGLG